MGVQQRYPTQILPSPLLLCLLVIIGLWVDNVQAWSANPGAFTSTTSRSRLLSSRPSIGVPSATGVSWDQRLRPDRSVLVLFEGANGEGGNVETEDKVISSKAEELKRTAEQMRLQAEEMEMKLIQEKLENLTKKMDKLNKKLQNAKPEEEKKNKGFIEEKINLTQQIKMLEYRLDPEKAKNEPPPTIPKATPVPQFARVSEVEEKKEEEVAAPSTTKSNEKSNEKEELMMNVNLFGNSFEVIKVTTNETLVNVASANMTEEEYTKSFDEYADKVSAEGGKVVLTIGEDPDSNVAFLGADGNRDCLWQSKEEEFVGTLSKDDLELIDEVEQKWQNLLEVRDATKDDKKKKKNPLMDAFQNSDSDEDDERKKAEKELEVRESIQFADRTFAEARAGNISKDELAATRFLNGAVNFCQNNVPVAVEVAMNLVEGFNVAEDDPLYMERFNLFIEAYKNTLFSLRRNRQESGVEEVFCTEVLDKNPNLFSRTAKARRVGSAFLFDGKVVEEDGNKIIAGLEESLDKSSLKDKVTLFYLRDPSPQIEMDDIQQADFVQSNGGEEDIGRALELINSFETPALLITGKNLESDKPISTKVGITTFALLNLVTTIGAFYYPNANPNYIQEFFAGIQSPVLVYLMGTLALQHVIQLVLALKGGFKTSLIPTLIPGIWGLPVVGSAVTINSPPKDKNDMFDFGFLAPFVGFLVSYGFIVLGLESTMQMTNAAEIARLPHIELDVLKQSFLTSATIESVMGTNMLLSLGDGVSSSVPLDPMVIAGYFGLMINAIQLLPTLVESDGGRAATAALGRFSVGMGGLTGLTILFLLVQAYRGGSPTLDFVALLITFRIYFGPEMPCQNDIDNASSARLVALGISLVLAFLTLSPA